jgi:hypothetical protein
MPDDIPVHPPEGHQDNAEDQRVPEVGDVELVYKLEGSRNELPIFELSRVLDALGTVIQEGNRIVHPRSEELVVRVKPFQEGSFIMDLVIAVQQDPTVLFALTHPEAIAKINQVLEYLGLIKKAKEAITSLMDLIRFLKNGRPAKVEPAGNNTYNYYNGDGQMMNVTAPVNNLVNNGTIQQFFFPAVGSPLQSGGIDALETFLKSEPKETAVRLPKSEVRSIQAYTAPPEPEPTEEVIVNETTEFLNPRSGMYGETDAPYIFTRVGQKKNAFKAMITDQKFLSKYERGLIRFYHDDVLKVKLKQEQHIKNGKGKIFYAIIEVLEYQKAPSPRTRR